jgi:N6-L-threonylcarbamoyladenine synthase
MFGRPDPNFSLSGLKTAVRLAAESAAPLNATDIKDLAASFQAAVVDMIDDRVRMGLKRFRERLGEPTALVVAGGVGANQSIRRVLQRLTAQAGLALAVPPPALCTDNGAMIAWAGIERLWLNRIDPTHTIARPRWPLDEKSAAPGAKA